MPTNINELDSVPEIHLRIPGPWTSPMEFRQALVKADVGYILNVPDENGETYLVDGATGRRFKFGAVEPDDELADIFAETGRPSRKEIDAIRNHNVKVFISGPGGSHNAAREFLAIGAAIIKAGGLGVMVDNSAASHGPADWLDLASDKGMGGMYWAFVAVTVGPELISSVGMHCMGFRDAEMPDPTDPKTNAMMMHEFLGYTYQSGVAIVDGDPIGGPEGPDFILRHVECTRFPRGMPWHNPYGIWRMEKFVDNYGGGDDDDE